MRGNHVRNLDLFGLCRGFYSVSGSVKDFAVKDRLFCAVAAKL